MIAPLEIFRPQCYFHSGCCPSPPACSSKSDGIQLDADIMSFFNPFGFDPPRTTPPHPTHSMPCYHLNLSALYLPCLPLPLTSAAAFSAVHALFGPWCGCGNHSSHLLSLYPPPPLYKLRPCPSYSRHRDRINWGH